MKLSQTFAVAISAMLAVSDLTAHAKEFGQLYAEKKRAFDGKLGPLDHTYVVVKPGENYANPAIGGSNSGGTYLNGTRGSGDRDKARCVARKTLNCGIAYLVTGVCHQGANRLLRPAGTTVTQARGYWLSWPLFGTYGEGSRVGGIQWLACRLGCGL